MKHLLVIFGFLSAVACAPIAVEPSTTADPYIYRFGPGDRVKIIVFGEAALSGEFSVDGTGMIAFPLLGQVTAAGKTIESLRAELTTRLGTEYVRSPKVTIEVANFRPVYILGEVARPGEFPFLEGLQAIALVAKAGGFTYRANQTVAFIRHEGETTEKAYSLSGSLVIRPGDTVRIGERYF